jgi:glycosyltransferase involved in cell wall biosynthesis
MTKIVSITVNSPSNFGGAEIVWYNLKKAGLKFYNISSEENNSFFFYKVIPNTFHLKEIFSAKYLLKKALKKNPDLIIYDKIFGWPTINTSIKKICYNHGSYTLAGLTFKKKNYIIHLIYKHFLSYFEKKSYENADKIIAVSESVKNEMSDYFKIPGKKIVVIDNGVDLNKFRPIKNKVNLRRKYGLPVNKRILLFPGRPSFGKGFDLVEKIMENLTNDYLMIVLSEGKSKSKNIKFIGKKKNEEMPEIYSLADLTVFPSRYEGSSVSVLESAACGTPLVLSQVGLMKNQKKLNDFICENYRDYVSKIKFLLDNETEYKKSKKAWLSLSKKFSLTKQIKKINKLIENE